MFPKEIHDELCSLLNLNYIHMGNELIDGKNYFIINIKNRLYNLYLMDEILSRNVETLKALILDELCTKVNGIKITFPLKLEADFVQEGVFYNNGVYYATEYDAHLLSMRLNHGLISSGNVKFFSNPTYEQFIAC